MGLALVLALAGCSGPPPPAPTTTTASPTPTFQPYVIATARADSVEVYARPEAAQPRRTVSGAEALSLPERTPLTFLVLERRPEWVRVLLPDDGSGGWVAAADVLLARSDYAVEVALGDGELVLRRAEEIVFETTAEIGPDAPPPGRYYLKELLQPPDPGGPYGSFTYGLAGFPAVLDPLVAGEGVVGIHGTTAVSVPAEPGTGSIRLTDADIIRLVDEFGLPLGTPVEVTA